MDDYYLPQSDEKLNWDWYPSYDDIITDKTSTLFITLEDLETSQEAFVQLQKWSEKRYPKSELHKDEYGNESLRIIDKSNIALSFCVDNCLAVRFLDPALKNELHEYLRDTYLESESFVEINHIEEKFPIWKSKLQVLSRTGVTKNNKDGKPYSFWNIYQEKNFVSKALIGFNTGEMCDCAPTILMFEVFPKYRRKGLGDKIIHGIEYYMYDYGFGKIRLENTKTIPFWCKLGYEIDIDEGEKNLGYLDFENNSDK